MDFTNLKAKLEENGYTVAVFATAAEAATEREIKEMAGARGDEANTRPCPFSGKRLLIFQALTSGLWAAIIRW